MPRKARSLQFLKSQYQCNHMALITYIIKTSQEDTQGHETKSAVESKAFLYFLNEAREVVVTPNFRHVLLDSQNFSWVRSL